MSRGRSRRPHRLAAGDDRDEHACHEDRGCDRGARGPCRAGRRDDAEAACRARSDARIARQTACA